MLEPGTSYNSQAYIDGLNEGRASSSNWREELEQEQKMEAYEKALSESDAKLTSWIRHCEEQDREYEKMYTVAQTLSGVLEKIQPDHPLTKTENKKKLFHGEIKPEDFGVTVPPIKR